MTARIARIKAWLANANNKGLAVASETLTGNLRRVRWLVLVVIPLNLVNLAIFWMPGAGGTPQQLAWRNATGWAHLCMATVLAVSGLLAHRTIVRSRVGAGARLLEFVVLFSSLVCMTALSAIDQWVTPNISPYLLACVFVALLFLMRPSVIVPLYLGTYGLFYAAMGLTQHDASQLLSNRLNGLGAAVMGAALALVLWHKNAGYARLQRELNARNAALMQQQQELLWLAKRDALTGLLNRGEFLRLADVELKRAQRHCTDTSAIMVDMDYFKMINDVHGHPAGDSALKHAAACLAGNIRVTDVVARVGGEEFMVLLPQTSADAAMVLAEKLLHAMREAPVVIGADLKIAVTASFGVGTLPAGHVGTVEWLYAAADHALYEAKRLGRDRVERTEHDASLTPSDFQRMRRQ